MADFDLAVIGGGLNGALIARDASGRGLRTLLIEQSDFGAGNSLDMGLIQGDLAGIERGNLLGVRRALAERATWLRIAPHLVRPVQMAMPAHRAYRTPLGVRTLLALHDRLSPRDGLARATTLDVTHHAVGVPLQRPFGVAFAWTEAVADTARIIVVSVLDAAERGATVMTGARCVRADRARIWTLSIVNRGQRISVTARALANAAGAWIPSVAETVLRQPAPPTRLVLASQIVVRRRFDHDGIYALQTSGGDFVQVASVRDGVTTIGTISRAFTGDPAIVSPSARDIEQLAFVVNGYFRERIEPADVIHAEAGAHAIPAGGNPRSGVVRLHARRDAAPLLSVYGGDLTMSRRRAERAVSRLTPFYPMLQPWTATAPLPGGDFGATSIDDYIDDVRQRWRFLGDAQARRLVAAYGTRLDRVFGDATHRDHLGPWFGDDLSAAEVRYVMAHEWARFPDDILWRRSRLGLSLDATARDALAAYMASLKAGSVEPGRPGS